jgi:hypothetical protein
LPQNKLFIKHIMFAKIYNKHFTDQNIILTFNDPAKNIKFLTESLYTSLIRLYLHHLFKS